MSSLRHTATRLRRSSSLGSLGLRVGLCLSMGLAALASACRPSNGGDASDAGPDAFSDPNFPYPEPRHDLVPAVGSADTFELATWNIENFPKNATTPALAADLIASMDLDMVALQEVEDVAAFNELVSRLRGYEGRLSSHTYSNGEYQKIGYVFKSDLVSLSGDFLLFDREGYVFPRPPFKVDVVVDAEEPLVFTAIALHLKAGGAFQDRERRAEAINMLDSYLSAALTSETAPNFALLGDFNTTLDSGYDVFKPLVDNTTNYQIHTTALASSGAYSFVPSGSLIDHVVTTQNFSDELSGAETLIPHLDDQMSGYVSQVSDHVPVVVRIPLR